MSDDTSKRNWVTRVLGCKFPSAADADPAAATLARWREAIADAQATLAQFGKTVLANAGVAADPRLKFVAAAVAEFPRMLPADGRKVDALIAAASKSPNGGATILKAVAAYRHSLAGADRLAKLEAFAQSELKSPLDVRAKLGAAIDAIEANLRKAA